MGHWGTFPKYSPHNLPGALCNYMSSTCMKGGLELSWFPSGPSRSPARTGGFHSFGWLLLHVEGTSSLQFTITACLSACLCICLRSRHSTIKPGCQPRNYLFRGSLAAWQPGSLAP